MFLPRLKMKRRNGFGLVSCEARGSKPSKLKNGLFYTKMCIKSPAAQPQTKQEIILTASAVPPRAVL